MFKIYFNTSSGDKICERDPSDPWWFVSCCFVMEADDCLAVRSQSNICESNGLILSPTKCKLAIPRIEFLGAEIGEGKLRLQPHIIKKIVEVKDDQLKNKKGLRYWLGILNYARTYIPNLSSKLGPLYEKTSIHGDKRMKPSDWALVQQIKAQVQTLPDLEIPPENSFSTDLILAFTSFISSFSSLFSVWISNKSTTSFLETGLFFIKSFSKLVMEVRSLATSFCSFWFSNFRS